MIFEAQSHFDLAWSPRSHYLEDNLVYVGTLYAPLVCKRVEVTESQFYPPSDFEWTLDPWDRRSRLARVSSVFRPYAPQVKASANLVTSIPLPLGSTIQVNAGWESGHGDRSREQYKQTGITPRSGRLLRISSARSICLRSFHR
jgi:hypothetical protein